MRGWSYNVLYVYRRTTNDNDDDDDDDDVRNSAPSEDAFAKLLKTYLMNCM